MRGKLTIPESGTNDGHHFEIMAAMTSVVRVCLDIIEDSYRGRWVPRGTGPAPSCIELDRAARRQVLNKLLTAIDCASTVLAEVEREHQARPHPDRDPDGSA